MSKTRRKYNPEFKREAVKLAKKVGFTKAGSELGVHQDNIRRWAKTLKSKKNEGGHDTSVNAVSLRIIY